MIPFGGNMFLLTGCDLRVWPESQSCVRQHVLNLLRKLWKFNSSRWRRAKLSWEGVHYLYQGPKQRFISLHKRRFHQHSRIPDLPNHTGGWSRRWVEQSMSRWKQSLWHQHVYLSQQSFGNNLWMSPHWKWHHHSCNHRGLPLNRMQMYKRCRKLIVQPRHQKYHRKLLLVMHNHRRNLLQC